MDISDSELMSFLSIMEWLAIERAAMLAEAGFDGEAELTRFSAGYHENALKRHTQARII